MKSEPTYYENPTKQVEKAFNQFAKFLFERDNPIVSSSDSNLVDAIKDFTLNGEEEPYFGKGDTAIHQVTKILCNVEKRHRELGSENPFWEAVLVLIWIRNGTRFPIKSSSRTPGYMWTR